MGPRMLGLRKPGTGAGHWAMMHQNLGPEPKEVEPPAKDYPGYRSVVLPAAKPADKPATKPAAKPATKPAAKLAAKTKKLMKGARWTSLTQLEKWQKGSLNGSQLEWGILPEYEYQSEQYSPYDY